MRLIGVSTRSRRLMYPTLSKGEATEAIVSCQTPAGSVDHWGQVVPCDALSSALYDQSRFSSSLLNRVCRIHSLLPAPFTSIRFYSKEMSGGGGRVTAVIGNNCGRPPSSKFVVQTEETNESWGLKHLLPEQWPPAKIIAASRSWSGSCFESGAAACLPASAPKHFACSPGSRRAAVALVWFTSWVRQGWMTWWGRCWIGSGETRGW